MEDLEENEGARVRGTIYTRALHSCVIEFPSSLWQGFSLLMASCVSERQAVISALHLLKRKKEFTPKSLY